MELFVSASVVVAFIAGVTALFAPCCITVLLPSYFASIFRERRKVFLMTFIFFLGILAVFLPMGLGAAALGQLFSRYHNLFFTIGGLFVTALGAMLLLGKHFSLPWSIHPSIKKYNALSVFTLGVFSAIATTCCAPVLAGVLALAALPGSVFLGGLYAVSYVFGMVAPLFFISIFLDKVNLTSRFNIALNKTIEYSFAGKRVKIVVSEIISGLTFLAMGITILYLASTNRLFAHSAYQTSVNIYLTKTLQSVSGFIRAVPELIWILLLITVIGGVAWSAIRQFIKDNRNYKK
ncbi:MAG: cytochrome c biogenesis protein CcdA [bacterium]|nr:cytochrome c biogenesis protein CcdA [bacterium]